MSSLHHWITPFISVEPATCATRPAKPSLSRDMDVASTMRPTATHHTASATVASCRNDHATHNHKINQPIKSPVANVAANSVNEWNKSDWHDYFNERAAVAEYDGQQPRDVAERMAYEACVVRWMDLHPVVQADASVCPHCHRPNGEVGRSSVPVLNGNGHLWLHHACLQPMLTERRKQAIQQLGSYGLHSHDKSMASRQMCG